MSSYYCCLSDGVWEAGIIYIDRSDHRAFPSLSVACLFCCPSFPSLFMHPLFWSGQMRAPQHTLPLLEQPVLQLCTVPIYSGIFRIHIIPQAEIRVKILEIYKLAPPPLWTFLLQFLSLIPIRLSGACVTP